MPASPGEWEKTEEEIHRVLVAMDFKNSIRAEQKKGLKRLDRHSGHSPLPKWKKT